MRLGDTKVIAQFLLAARTGKDVVLKSSGKQFFSYCYVADVVSALLIAMLTGESGQAYNVAHPSGDIHLKDLAQLVGDAGGSRVVLGTPEEAEARGYSASTMAVMDGSKIARLGWTPRYSLEEGIARTLTVLREVYD